MILSEILRQLDEVAPTRFALSFDKVGLQLGSPDQEVTRALVSLDHSADAIARAEATGANLLLTHHPLIWNPVPRLIDSSANEREIRQLARAGIASVAAHTNWDCAPGGVNDTLADRLSLTNVSKFGTSNIEEVILFTVYVPREAAARLLSAFEEAGLGQLGLYSGCAFASDGIGTFRPAPGANPTVGSIGQREEVAESRLEVLTPRNREADAVAVVKQLHPYEEPVFFSVPAGERSACPIGRIGDLAQPISLSAFVKRVDEQLGTASLAWGDPDRIISRAAVVGGSAADELGAARAAGADVFVTGEVPQHIAAEIGPRMPALLCSGHYATEQPGVEALCDRMAERCPSVEWEVFEPKPGHGGRPIFRP